MSRPFANCLLLALSLSATACVVVGIPVAVPGKKPFAIDKLDSIEVGTATVVEVENLFGEPNLRGQSWWLYHSARDGWQWAMCALPAYGQGDCDVTPRGSTDYFLLVDFDDRDDAVSGMNVFTKDSLCEARRICYEGNLKMQEAATALNEAVEPFGTSDRGCTVHTYSTTAAAGELMIDGHFVGGLLGDSGYYVHRVGQGSHAWIVMPHEYDDLSREIGGARFDCKHQETAFLRYSKGLFAFKLETVDADQGIRDIGERWRAASEPDMDDEFRSNWLRDGEVFVTKEPRSLRVFRFNENGRLLSWGKSSTGEFCGLRAALEDYGFIPFGGVAHLLIYKSRFRQVRIGAVCSNDTYCKFQSVIDGEYCDAEPGTIINFDLESWLLVLEARQNGYSTLFNDSAKRLRAITDHCNGLFGYDCRLDANALREF